MELMRRNPVKFKLDVSDASVVDRPSYLARSVIINHAGNRVGSTSCQQRKGEIIYRLVDPQAKNETDDRRLIAVGKTYYALSFPSTRLRWLPNALEGSSGLGEAVAPRNVGLRPATKAS